MLIKISYIAIGVVNYLVSQWKNWRCVQNLKKYLEALENQPNISVSENSPIWESLAKSLLYIPHSKLFLSFSLWITLAEMGGEETHGEEISE